MNWFVGFPLDPGITWEAPPEGLSLLAPGDLHLTLAFLGGVEEEAALEAWSYVTSRGLRALDVCLAEIEGFGPSDRPSAFAWTLGQGGDEVGAWMSAHRDPCRAVAGVAPEGREPRPHVTVARPGRRATAEQRRAMLAWCQAQAVPAQTFTLDRVCLYGWAASGAPTRYRVHREEMLNSL